MPPERNNSLIPTEDILECFPGLWLDRQARAEHGDTTTTTAVSALRASTTTMPSGLTESPCPAAGICRLETPFDVHCRTTLVCPTTFPSQTCREVIVYTFALDPVRLVVPWPATAANVSRLVASELALPSAVLCWPPVVPCVAGEPTHVIVWPPDLPPDASVGLVDARRVHPLRGPHFWLAELASPAASMDLVAAAISQREICVTPAGARIDGQLIGRRGDFRPGVRTLNLLSGRACEAHYVCFNSDPFSRLPGTATFGLVPIFTSTTTTTVPEFPDERPIAASVGLRAGPFLPLSIYASTGLCRPLCCMRVGIVR